MKPTDNNKVVSETPRGNKNVRRILTVAACLLLVVGLGIASALPGIGQNIPVYEMNCRTVHVHDENCTVTDRDGVPYLVCGKAAFALHEHDENCYSGTDEQGEPIRICTLPVFTKEDLAANQAAHVHGPECQRQIEVLVCDQEETGHVHTDSCYAEPDENEPNEENLICNQVEHEHGEGCYAIKLKLVLACELDEEKHIHNENDCPLTCGFYEDEEFCAVDGNYVHRKDEPHTDDCYALTCDHEADEELESTDPEEQEDLHTDECSELVCELVAHQHTDECYESCEITSHTHVLWNERWLDKQLWDYAQNNEIEGGTIEYPDPEDYDVFGERSQKIDGGCYEIREVESSVLWCGEEEHTHTPACYEREPICEEESGHRHSDACYEMITVPCSTPTELHTHFEGECYDENHHLTCGKIEFVEHQHTVNDCLEEKEPTNDKTGDNQGSTDSSDGFIFFDDHMLLGKGSVNTILYYIDPEDGKTKNPIDNDAMLEEYLDYFFAIDVKVRNWIPKYYLETCKYTIHYQLPSYFKLVEAAEPIVINDEGTRKEVGEIRSVPGENLVILTFFEKSLENTDIIKDLAFSVSGEFDLEEIADPNREGDIFGIFNVEVTGRKEEFLSKYSDLKLEKNLHTDATENPLQIDAESTPGKEYYYVEYELRVKAGDYGYPFVNVHDAFENDKDEQALWFGQGPNGQIVEKSEEKSWIEYTISGDTNNLSERVNERKITAEDFHPDGNPPASSVGFTWNIGDMKANEVRALTYRVYLNKAVVDKNTSYKMDNTATAYSTSLGAEKSLKPSAKRTAFISASAKIDKVGIPAPNREINGASIEYRVLIKANAKNQHVLDLILTDTMDTDRNADRLPYMSFNTEEGIKVYEGDYCTEIAEDTYRPLRGTPRAYEENKLEWSPLPEEGVSDLWFKIYDMAPGEEYTIVYTIDVSAGAYQFDNYEEESKTFFIGNWVDLKTQELSEEESAPGATLNLTPEQAVEVEVKRPEAQATGLVTLKPQEARATGFVDVNARKLSSGDVATTEQKPGSGNPLTGQDIDGNEFVTELTKNQWVRKVLGDRTEARWKDFDIKPGIDTIYYFGEDTALIPKIADGDTELRFPIEREYYEYTVEINNGGIWDINSWAMIDTLDDSDEMAGGKVSSHMEYVGYVKVTGTRKAADGSADITRTVWVDVNGMKKFSFSGTQLGFESFTDSNWEYTLVYYTQPKNIDKLVNVVFGNRFELDRRGGQGGGSQKSGFNVQVQETLAGTLKLDGTKKAWYYYAPKDSNNEPDTNLNNHGFYWVLELTSDEKILKDVELVDEIAGGTHGFLLGPDQSAESFVVDAFIAGPDIDIDIDKITGYGSYHQFIDAWDGSIEHLTAGEDREVPDGESENDYAVIRSSEKELRIRFLNTLDMGPGRRLYFVIKTIPSKLPGDMPTQYKNALYASAKNEKGNKHPLGIDVISLPGSHGVEKMNSSLFLADGNGTNQDIQTDLNAANGVNNAFMPAKYYNGEEEVNLEPGMYVTWLIDTNVNGDLLGEFEVRDEIPAGMVPVSVALYNIDNYDESQSKALADESRRMPVPGTTDAFTSDSDWTPHRSGASRRAYIDWENWSYYTREIGDRTEVAWRVNWSHYGTSDKCMGRQGEWTWNDETYAYRPYKVTFAIICRITDEEVLMGASLGDNQGELEGGSGKDSTKQFTNVVRLYKLANAGETVGANTKVFDEREVTRLIQCAAQLIKEMPAKHASTVECTINVNPNGMKLLNRGGNGSEVIGNKLEVIDIMSENVQLVDSDSIKILVFDNDELYPEGRPITDLTAEELGWDREWNGDEDLYCRIDPATGGTVMWITLPDGKKIQVIYEIRVNADPNEVVSVRNVAFFKGHYATLDNVKQTTKQKIAMEVSYTDAAIKLTLTKRDYLTNQPLEGATFRFTEASYNANTKEFEISDTNWVEATTDENGVLEIDNANSEDGKRIKLYTFYYLEEVEAPSEHVAREPEFVVFVYGFTNRWLYSEDAAQMEGNGLTIYRLEPNELTITLPELDFLNSKGEITVTKKFEKEGGGEMNPPIGEYKFGLYTKNSDGDLVAVTKPKQKQDSQEKDEDYIVVINVTDENKTDEVFTAKFENLEPGIYYVFELDANGNRLTDKTSWERNNWVFVTEYEDNMAGLDDPDTGKSMAGEVVVTNTAIRSYGLPKTGGEGFATILYTIGGLLAVSTGLVFAMKKRRKGQE